MQRILSRKAKISRFGFITTNSLRQTFNRRIVQAALDKGLHLAFAIPDHPWVENSDGAAVRIAMTVAAEARMKAGLCTVSAERAADGQKGGEGLDVELTERSGSIHADLSIGANVSAAKALRCEAKCLPIAALSYSARASSSRLKKPRTLKLTRRSSLTAMAATSPTGRAASA
jgi:hypothetical protein